MRGCRLTKRVVRVVMIQLAGWHAALMFYTCLPIPAHWPLEFRWIAKWAPWVGLVVGGLMAIADASLRWLHMPVPLSSALVIALGMAITGGLHVDGVMDTADGLAVPDASRRLVVMTDSHMGAFGGMAAIVLILLKVLALASVIRYRAFVLVAVAVWGRWAQQWAIARYPYLKKEGKGAFHKAALPTVWHAIPGLLLIVLLGCASWAIGLVSTGVLLRILLGGCCCAVVTSGYLARKLGGHTGDTYGAVVEWSEAFLLCIVCAG